MAKGIRRKEVKELERKVNIIMPEELWIALKVDAARKKTSMSEIVTRLVARYIKEQEKRG